jgi:hypothetical protein
VTGLGHNPHTLEQEFDAQVARSGLTIPDERRATMLKCYADVRGWADLIRRHRREPSAEPANTYALETITRAGEDAA